MVNINATLDVHIHRDDLVHYFEIKVSGNACTVHGWNAVWIIITTSLAYVQLAHSYIITQLMHSDLFETKHVIPTQLVLLIDFKELVDVVATVYI